MSRFRPAPLLIPLAAVLLLGGCSGVLRRGVERRAVKRLSEFVGPAEHYRVRILDTRDAELAKGRAKRVEVEGRKIMARGQLQVEQLRLTLRNLRYEGVEPYFVSVQRSDLEVELTEEALNRYLRTYQAELEPELRFEPGVVHASVLSKFLGLPVRLKASGRLLVREGKQLIFDADSADLSILARPEQDEERLLEERLNPLLDLSKLELPARLESVEIGADRLRARGSAAIPRTGHD